MATRRVACWFRKGLRLHDNPALCQALRWTAQDKQAKGQFYPIFILDQEYLKVATVGPNRLQFILESLHCLDESIKRLTPKGSGLICLRGRPLEVIRKLILDLEMTHLTFEWDTEPYSQQRDAEVRKLCTDHKVEVACYQSHTLHDTHDLLTRVDGHPPLTYVRFQDLLRSLNVHPRLPVKAPEKIPAFDLSLIQAVFKDCNVPTDLVAAFGYKVKAPEKALLFHGGEIAGLERLKSFLTDEERTVNFEKPKTAPTGISPITNSTTVLSPYLEQGCVSVALFWHELARIIERHRGEATKPPVSLQGQLLWREFFYLIYYAYGKSLETTVTNPICLQHEWDLNQEPKGKQKDDQRFKAWREGRTGFPWIDACMTQLRTEGWLHHLARHAVACFLTRGDLYLSWELGRDVFDEWLIDDDASINNCNWLWLSCSAFFTAYYRVYSPISFPKKTDPKGLFVKHYLPQLANFSSKYIYEPWTAPLNVQEEAKCIIGKDYPFPICDHSQASSQNIDKLRESFAAKEHGTPNPDWHTVHLGPMPEPIDLDNGDEDILLLEHLSSPKAPPSKRRRSLPADT